MKKHFNKRTFDLPLLAKSSAMVFRSIPQVAQGLVKPKTSRALQEQVMLAVTSVNDCRYCDWVHTGLALEEGVNMEELSQLLNTKDNTTTNTPQAVAILFAQHFSDTKGKPSAQAKERLAAHFNQEEQREIMAFIHAIYFANLSGNSFDSIVARLQGIEIQNGHLLAESLASILSAPILMGVWLQSKRQKARPLAAL